MERRILLLGLARTGTTKLQRTISADPGVQRLELWRLLNPAPWRASGANGVDPRIRFAELEETELSARSPEIMAAHALEAHEPDEETLLLELTFSAMTHGQVQSYSRTGMQLTAEALAAFDGYQARRPAHHFGRHVYSAERYGLDEPRIRAAFAGYYETFADLLG